MDLAVFDVDGVLADVEHRRHHVSGARRDWDAFFDACGEDPLIDEVATLLHHLDERAHVLRGPRRPARAAEQDERRREPGAADDRQRHRGHPR